MDAPEMKELRRRVYELQETQRWVHHVADLNSGKSQTFRLDRPITPLSRAERLSRLGHAIEPSIFDGPSYTLTPRNPYQASPMAYLGATGALVYGAYNNQIWWSQAQDPGNNQGGMGFTFAVSPARQRSLVSISLLANAWPGMVGHVLVSANLPASASIEFPIADDSGPLPNTVDLIFTPHSSQQTDIFMTLEAGIQYLAFQSISFSATTPPAI